uniref:Uncharacterized protein n=1 Tax=Arundo donax TaxID=35708 RepID=A0A0A9AFN2_ARUDO
MASNHYSHFIHISCFALRCYAPVR